MSTPVKHEDEGAERIRDNARTEETDKELRFALALAEYVDLLSNETPVDIDLFCKQHRDCEAELRREIATLGQFDVLNEDAVQSEDVPPKLPVEKLSGHRILSEIGSGGMGQVYLAVDDRLGRKVAIKTLKAHYMNDPALRARFMREARAMAKLSHPNIVQIYGLGEPDEVPHFVMEYLEGRPLDEVALPLPLRQKVELMHKVVLAVDFLHQHQLLHRDLKPANILVGPDLDPKLLDFGLALEVGELTHRMTHAGAIVGTPIRAVMCFPSEQSSTRSSPAHSPFMERAQWN